MTTRDLLNAIINGSELNDEHIAKAKEMLNSISKERKPSKADLEKQALNDALKNEIHALLVERGSMIASAIVEALSSEERPLSTSKVSSMCRQLVDAERATVADVKVKGKGTVKQYTAI
jgi:hypothetical protein